jgi:ABC-type Zn2+ transport system substrate-binding protein/surface adhesin
VGGLEPLFFQFNRVSPIKFGDKMNGENTNNQLNENNNTSENLHEQNHEHVFFSHFHGHSHTHGKVDPPQLLQAKGSGFLNGHL